jgi:hypothetical protein
MVGGVAQAALSFCLQIELKIPLESVVLRDDKILIIFSPNFT